jgi:hypothetical protein
MSDTKRMFSRGDFLKKNNKKGSFMIYEGNNISDSSYKRMTLVCIYDPEKYMMGSLGYEQKPHLEVGTTSKPCLETIDTEQEDYWISICTDNEKEQAIDILAKYGYYWNAESMELIKIETGEVIRKLVIPDNTYHGEVIKPTSDKFRELAKKYCSSKLTPSYSMNHYPDCYDD